MKIHTATTTLTSREFNQDTGRAKKAAQKGPVIITDRGEPSYVLLNFRDYEKSQQKEPTIADLLSCPEAAELDFNPPRMKGGFRPAKFD